MTSAVLALVQSVFEGEHEHEHELRGEARRGEASGDPGSVV